MLFLLLKRTGRAREAGDSFSLALLKSFVETTEIISNFRARLALLKSLVETTEIISKFRARLALLQSFIVARSDVKVRKHIKEVETT